MPIAIVGMACRLPGEATSPDKLWKLCAEKQAAWSEVPKDRMNLEAFYHPDGERAGNVWTTIPSILFCFISSWGSYHCAFYQFR